MDRDYANRYRNSIQMWKIMERIKFSQEKYSNGETTLQMLDDYIEPDGLYLLDEPEVSLSPKNQIILAEKLNNAARYLGCQFIISTHSPFLLGTLNGKIYNLDSDDLEVEKWTELENVKCFFEFFEERRKEFLADNK